MLGFWVLFAALLILPSTFSAKTQHNLLFSGNKSLFLQKEKCASWQFASYIGNIFL